MEKKGKPITIHLGDSGDMFQGTDIMTPTGNLIVRTSIGDFLMEDWLSKNSLEEEGPYKEDTGNFEENFLLEFMTPEGILYGLNILFYSGTNFITVNGDVNCFVEKIFEAS